VFPKATSTGGRDRALKAMVEASRQHLHLDPENCTTITSTKGIKRNVEFVYPRQFNNAVVRERVLLEMGSRGGPNPHTRHALRSMIADYAIEQLGESVNQWQEFEPVEIEVLNPERTLLEKCALLHNLAARFGPDDPVAVDYMGRAGRHYYDLEVPHEK